MSSRSFLLVLGALLVVSAVSPRLAQAQTTKLFIDSQAGDPVGGGHVTTFTTADATFSAWSYSTTGTTISLSLPGGSFAQWELDFKAAGVNKARLSGSTNRRVARPSPTSPGSK
jgi:hypothetical protein